MTSASAKITLDYPLYACDFDPHDASRLIVGGGGGASKTGVGNKITVLESSSPTELSAVAEIELSRDEDSVTNLAVGPRKGKATLVFGGINSGPDDLKRGNNQHFRVFSVDQPSRSKAAAGTGPKITELSRSSLFTTGKDADAYQRVLRLSSPFPGSPQAGAVATGFAKQHQIAVFDVPGSSPRLRHRLDLDKEAMDLDLIQTSEDPARYRLVYCNDYDIYSVTIAKGSGSDAEPSPALIYTTPHDDATGAPRPTFRALRFLSPSFLLAVGNLPKRAGAVLIGYRLAAADAQSGTLPARLSITAKLPKHVAQATSLAVVNLNPPSTPGAAVGDTQFVVAVAGIDCSITLYTLEHQSVASVDMLSKLYPFATIRDAHPQIISSLAFSRFQAPGPPATSSLASASASSPSKSFKSAAALTANASSSSSSARAATGPAVLKLASTSVAKTVVVHVIPLKKHPADQKSKAARRPGPPRPRQPARYVVAARSTGPSPKGLLLTLTLGAAFFAFLMQFFLEIRGLTPSNVLGAASFAPASWVHVRPDTKPLLVQLGEAATPYVLREGSPENGGKLRVSEHVAGGGTEREEADPLSWDQLPPAQRKAWKERLKAAGHWGEEMGEAIFKGILFGEMGGAVGDFVRG